MTGRRVFQPHAVGALALRVLRAYFETPTAYVALFVFFCLAGYLFVFPLFLVGQASLKGLMDFMPLLLTLLIPGLTMSLLSEELRSGTFETLATMPVEDWDIVLGKFLGFSVLLAAAVGSLAFFGATVSLLAQPPTGLDWGETAGVLSGLYLLGLALGAAGLFASSLGKNQIVAFVTAFLIGFLFFLAGKFSGFFPGLAGTIVEFLGADSHLEALAKGVFDTRDLLYFASVTFAFLYMTVERLEQRRF